MPRHQFHALTPEEVVTALQTDLKNGLGDAEIKVRLAQYGPNRLAQEAATAWWHVLLRQFTNFLILILLVAALLSYFLGDWMDMVAILAIVALNGLLGFAQEWKAQTALAALQKMLTPFCHVIRNGSPQQIDATLLVPGDIVLLESGALIPADMRLIDAVNVKADESALTGESVAVTKDSTPVDENAHLTARTCMAWMGTHIVNGHARGIVTATGMDTEFGRISALTGAITETPTRLQNQLRVLAHQLTIAVIVVTAIVVFAGWLGGRPLLQMVMAGISLSVAAVPEGLPAVVTITLALGMRAMARRKALLRHLQTAETLGATSVICTDKTGTLTKNEMTIQRIWLANAMVSLSGAGYDPTGQFSIAGQSINPLDNPDLRALLEAGRVCNHAHITPTDFGWVATGSPTEAAFITAVQKAELPDNPHEILCEFSFNGARKRMSVIEKRAGDFCVHIKGAPEIILAR
ncbi:MAG TPA: HAD-IC family P-type ATPase, partial [Micavibrio sp.]